MASALDLDEAERRKAEAVRGRTWFFSLRRRSARKMAASQVSAVCIPPGARLRMTHIPVDLRQRWALRAVEDVRFTETGDDPDRFRDAIRFGNGKLLVLQTLPQHICFMVLSLGSGSGGEELQVQPWRDTFLSLRTSPLW